MVLPPSASGIRPGNTILHQKSAMGHGSLPAKGKASTSVSGTQSSKDFAATLKQTGGPNGPVAPVKAQKSST